MNDNINKIYNELKSDFNINRLQGKISWIQISRNNSRINLTMTHLDFKIPVFSPFR